MSFPLFIGEYWRGSNGHLTRRFGAFFLPQMLALTKRVWNRARLRLG
jgi:hypothetical protein